MQTSFNRNRLQSLAELSHPALQDSFEDVPEIPFSVLPTMEPAGVGRLPAEPCQRRKRSWPWLKLCLLFVGAACVAAGLLGTRSRERKATE